jgi:hypothetical protein
MSEPFIVEIWGEPAGIVLREGNAFRFHATASPFFELDGTPFSTPGHARLAAAGLKRADGHVLPDDLRWHRDGRLS